MVLGLRRDEEFARQAFERYLESKGVVNQEWKKGGGRRKPPDCYLTVGGEEFAVEITTLMEQVTTPRRSVPIAALDKSAIDFVRDVEVSAKRSGTLCGTYYVFFSSQDYHAVRKRLKDKILAFIESSRDVEEVFEENFQLNGRTYCSVTKIVGKENTVKLGSPPDYAVNLEGMFRVAGKRLQDALIEKYDKLNKQQVNQPRILVLRNSVSFVDSPIYRQYADLDHLEDFHTIFIVGSENYILHSENPNWV